MQSCAITTVRVLLCTCLPTQPFTCLLVRRSVLSPTPCFRPPVSAHIHSSHVRTLPRAAKCCAERRGTGAESERPSCSGNFQSPGEPDMFTGCSETRPAETSPSLTGGVRAARAAELKTSSAPAPADQGEGRTGTGQRWPHCPLCVRHFTPSGTPDTLCSSVHVWSRGPRSERHSGTSWEN